MLEQLMRLYVMAMNYDVRSPMPHLVGPPGCGKSTSVEQLAELLGVNLHIMNVSRLSPLEIEGVQMPHGAGEEMILKMLPATFWTQLKEGDILLMDEFLRGFPEVYSGLLDIFTSRRVGAHVLPKIFIIGASNSVVAYDQALEDRLLHLAVPDPRKSQPEKKRLAQILVDSLGLMPEMVDWSETDDLINNEVLPMYNLLDSFKKKGTNASAATEGSSLRNLIGQAQLRQIESADLKALINANNVRAMRENKPQFVFLVSGKSSDVPGLYPGKALQLQSSTGLTSLQELNLRMNLELIALEAAANQEGDAPDDNSNYGA